MHGFGISLAKIKKLSLEIEKNNFAAGTVSNMHYHLKSLTSCKYLSAFNIPYALPCMSKARHPASYEYFQQEMKEVLIKFCTYLSRAVHRGAGGGGGSSGSCPPPREN